MAPKKKTVVQKLANDIVDGDMSYKGEEVTIAEIKEVIAKVESDLNVQGEKALVGYHPVTGEPVYI